MRVLINSIKFYSGVDIDVEETINQFQLESKENVFQMLFATRLRNITATCYSIGFPVAVSEKCDENPLENAVR